MLDHQCPKKVKAAKQERDRGGHMLILAIETACDDTAVALVRNGHDVLSSVVLTETKAQARFGGIVPELAARAQLEFLSPAIEDAIGRAGVELSETDAIAVNNRHGLLRSIVVGVAGAKALSLALNKPLIPIHHIEGHIYSALIENPDLPWPHVCLTVAGGHNLLLHAQEHGKYELVGRTLDDAAGEAYDKLARRLGLGFPGGLQIDRLAATGDPQAFALPRPMMAEDNLDFSFSGLKTAVMNLVDELERRFQDIPVADVAASFQAAVVDVLVSKAVAATKKLGTPVITVTGGVSANTALRTRLQEYGTDNGIKVALPSVRYCTDNAAMIACAAFYRSRTEHPGFHEALDASSNAPLGDLAVDYTTKKRGRRA
jgi:N6-L-threonylcarbamoyladenine synthase